MLDGNVDTEYRGTEGESRQRESDSTLWFLFRTLCVKQITESFASGLKLSHPDLPF